MKQESNQTQWYLLYTNPRAEKKAALELQKKGFEIFLPLQLKLKDWSDRKKWVEEPIFKSYIFIKTELEKNFFQILNTKGIVKFISFQGNTAVVDDREIELVKRVISDSSYGFENLSSLDLEIGDKVEIIAGPLKGSKANLLQTRSGDKIIIELITMRQKIIVKLQSKFVVKVS